MTDAKLCEFVRDRIRTKKLRITGIHPHNYRISDHCRNCVCILLLTTELPWYQNTIPMHLHQHLKKPIRLECTTSLEREGGGGRRRANTVSFYSGPFNKLKQPSTPSPLESSSNSVHFQNRVPPTSLMKTEANSKSLGGGEE